MAAAVRTELESHPIDHISRTEVAAAALAALAEGQSTWRAAEVVRELAAAVPPALTAEPGRLLGWLDEVAAEIIDAHMVELSPPVPVGMALRRDGRPVSESVLHRALSTPAIVAQEEALVLWADKRIEAGGVDAVSAARRTTLDLSGPQREVAAAVAGTRELVLVVGPAGTGKTTALAPAVAQLQADQRIQWANERLASYDRPFKRHRHRFDISRDHWIIEAARATIEEGREQLAALDAKSRRLQRELLDAKEQLSAVPELEANQHRVRARLRADLEIRAEQLSMDSLVVLPRHLGQRRENGIEAATWDRAAARIEQHRVAFAVTDDNELLGSPAGIFDDAYAASRRGAQEATHALEATLGRDRAIEREGPGLSL